MLPITLIFSYTQSIIFYITWARTLLDAQSNFIFFYNLHFNGMTFLLKVSVLALYKKKGRKNMFVGNKRQFCLNIFDLFIFFLHILRKSCQRDSGTADIGCCCVVVKVPPILKQAKKKCAEIHHHDKTSGDCMSK